MHNIDTLIDSISQKLSDPASQSTIYFSTLDITHAYNQLTLDPVTSNHCNFNIISGDMSGIKV